MDLQMFWLTNTHGFTNSCLKWFCRSPCDNDIFVSPNLRLNTNRSATWSGRRRETLLPSLCPGDFSSTWQASMALRGAVVAGHCLASFWPPPPKAGQPSCFHRYLNKRWKRTGETIQSIFLDSGSHTLPLNWLPWQLQQAFHLCFSSGTILGSGNSTIATADIYGYSRCCLFGPGSLWSSICDIRGPYVLVWDTLSCSRFSQGVHPTSFAGPVYEKHVGSLRTIFNLNLFKTLYGKRKVWNSTLSNIVCMRLS